MWAAINATKRPVLLILSSFMLLGACQKKEYHNEPLVVFQETNEIKDFYNSIKEIKIVSLENDDHFLGSRCDLIYDKGDYFIVDVPNNHLYRYDSNGHFACEYGRFGRGPGEFRNILNIQIIDDTVVIYSVPEMTALHYDRDGNYLRTETQKINGVQFYIVDNGILAFHGYGTSNCKVSLLTEGRQEDFYPYTSQVASFIDQGPIFTENGKYVFVRDPYERTIYQYVDGQVKPRLSIDFGTYAISDSFFSLEYIESAEYMMEQDICFISRYCESSDYRLLEVKRPQNSSTYYGVSFNDKWIWFNAGTKKSCLFADGIKDVVDDTLICLVEAPRLRQMDKELFAKIVNPEALSEIEKVENDVIMMVRLREW